MIIIDIIIIAIIALSTFIGYKKGLVKTAINALAFLIAIIVALTLYKPVSSIIVNNTQIDDNINNIIIEKLNPEGIAENQKIDIDNKLTEKILDGANNTIEEIANAFTIKIIEIGAMLIIFAGARIALIFVRKLADLIAKLPILKQINKTGRNNIWTIKGNNYSIYNIRNCLFCITINTNKCRRKNRKNYCNKKFIL